MHFFIALVCVSGMTAMAVNVIGRRNYYGYRPHYYAIQRCPTGYVYDYYYKVCFPNGTPPSGPPSPDTPLTVSANLIQIPLLRPDPATATNPDSPVAAVSDSVQQLIQTPLPKQLIQNPLVAATTAPSKTTTDPDPPITTDPDPSITTDLDPSVTTDLDPPATTDLDLSVTTDLDSPATSTDLDPVTIDLDPPVTTDPDPPATTTDIDPPVTTDPDPPATTTDIDPPVTTTDLEPPVSTPDFTTVSTQTMVYGF